MTEVLVALAASIYGLFARFYMQGIKIATLTNLLNWRQVDGSYEEVVLQRTPKKGWVATLAEAALKNFTRAPRMGVFATAIHIRLIPKEGCQDALIKALEACLPPIEWHKLVAWCYAIDGQHRILGVDSLEGAGENMLLDVCFVVCTDDYAETEFYRLNGLTRKMAPAAIDLSLAHQFMDDRLEDKKECARGIATLMTKSFIRAGSPYQGAIEMPFKAPAVKNPLLKFHKTVGSFYPVAQAKVDALTTMSKEDCMDQVNALAFQAGRIWLAVERVFPEFFSEEEKWQHGHLFNIIQVGMVNRMLLSDRKMSDSERKRFVKTVLTKFISWASTNPATASQWNNRFFGMSGSSSDGLFINYLTQLTDEVLA